MKSLIVEDDFTSRLLLQTLLSRLGECHIAVNGREAIEAFELATEQGTPYQLICMDLIMPEMNGQDAVKRVRALEKSRGILPDRGAKIFMTTAVRDMKEVMQSFQSLCDAYMFKPIDAAELLGHLKAFHLTA